MTGHYIEYEGKLAYVFSDKEVIEEMKRVLNKLGGPGDYHTIYGDTNEGEYDILLRHFIKVTSVSQGSV